MKNRVLAVNAKPSPLANVRYGVQADRFISPFSGCSVRWSSICRMPRRPPRSAMPLSACHFELIRAPIRNTTKSPSIGAVHRPVITGFAMSTSANRHRLVGTVGACDRPTRHFLDFGSRAVSVGPVVALSSSLALEVDGGQCSRAVCSSCAATRIHLSGLWRKRCGDPMKLTRVPAGTMR